MKQHKSFTLFPNGAPGEPKKLKEEESEKHLGIKIAGTRVLGVSNVSEPTITFYPAPKENNLGTTIIVVPGGGYNVLAYNLEGTEVCERFNRYGINCVLLKYRVPRRDGLPKHQLPLHDLQRAIALTRTNAEEWGIDRNKIGVMGFSAGAHLAAVASTNFDELSFAANDAIDEISVRPDFCILLYPAYLDGDNFTIVPELNVTDKTPPTFIVQTQDDFKLINSSLFYYYALKESKVPVAMHLYPTGYHGYGVRKTGHLVNEWPLRAFNWLKDIGMLEK